MKIEIPDHIIRRIKAYNYYEQLEVRDYHAYQTTIVDIANEVINWCRENKDLI